MAVLHYCYSFTSDVLKKISLEPQMKSLLGCTKNQLRRAESRPM